MTNDTKVAIINLPLKKSSHKALEKLSSTYLEKMEMVESFSYKALSYYFHIIFG